MLGANVDVDQLGERVGVEQLQPLVRVGAGEGGREGGREREDGGMRGDGGCSIAKNYTKRG